MCHTRHILYVSPAKRSLKVSVLIRMHLEATSSDAPTRLIDGHTASFSHSFLKSISSCTKPGRSIDALVLFTLDWTIFISLLSFSLSLLVSLSTIHVSLPTTILRFAHVNFYLVPVTRNATRCFIQGAFLWLYPRAVDVQ